MKQFIVVSFFLLSFGLFPLAAADAALRSLQPGMEAPDISLESVGGGRQSLEGLKGGKLTVLMFWSTWSAKSPAALARIERLYEKYKGQGLAVIGVNADAQDIGPEEISGVAAFCKKLGLSFPVLVDRGLTAFHDYGVIALPTTIVLDKDRLVVYELSGYPLSGAEALADFVTEALEGRTAPAPAGVQTAADSKAVRFFNLGTALGKTKSPPESAELWFRKAAAADPSFALPHISLGKLYADRGDWAAAEEEYRQALAKAPANPLALCELAAVLANQGREREAVALLEPGQNLFEQYPSCFYYAGYAYGKAGEAGKSMLFFSEAEKNSPFDYRLWQYEGRLFEESRDKGRAAAAYRKAVEAILHGDPEP